MSKERLKLQETLFFRAILTSFYKKMVSTQQIRHLWVASDTSISLVIINVLIRLSVLTLTFARQR